MSPIAFIGSHILSLCFPVALYSGLIYPIGFARGDNRLIRSAQKAAFFTCFLLTLAVVFLISAFFKNDFSILYVNNYSSRALPLFFKFTGLWAGLDGSILFWVWLVSIYAVIVLWQNRNKNPDWAPVMNSVLMGIILFFLIMILFANNPFTPNPSPSNDGRGLNPLLQNIAMVIHPPSLYLGYTGFAVPFAFVIAALVTRRLDYAWIETSRRWTLVAWFFLSLGNILGAAWAYVELGWGGFWAWDPVENAAIMPWFTATAYLHSVMIQQKRGMLAVWNVTLIIITFILTIFGTFLTRSGVVQSVHAFSDSKLGPFFLVFLALVACVALYFVLTRLPHLKSVNQLQSYWSKESAFVLNNIVLLVCSVAILWGTLFPTLSEALTGQRITVGPPFFNKIMAPLAVLLLALMGVGPMIAWKKSSWKNIQWNLLGPFLVGAVVSAVVYFLGFTHWYVVTSSGLMMFVLGTIVIEFYRGLRVVRVQKKLPFTLAFTDLIKNNNRRYGGYLIHVGVLFVFLAIAGTVFKTEVDFSLNPGQTYTYKDYRIHYLNPIVAESEHKDDFLAVVDLYQGQEKIATLKPAKYFYKKSNQPTTEVDMYHAPFKDFYLIIGGFDPDSGQADFRLTLNPLISFLWLGGFVILIGIIIVILPRGFKVKPSVASLILLFLFCGTNLHAEPFQHQDTDEKPYANQALDPTVAHQKSIAEKLNCMCGDCVRTDLKVCTCSYAKDERAKIAAMINQGKTDQDIIAAFVAQYGLGALVEPPYQGFFKTGYWMPFVFLFFAFGLGAFLIQKWRRRPVASTPELPTSDDSYRRQLIKELERLDD